MDGTLSTVSAARLGAVERFASDWVSEDRISGATLSVFDADGTVTAAFGASELERNVAATPDTLLGIGSCTKSFTGIAILQLAEEGKLAVDDPVSDYVDTYDDVHVGADETVFTPADAIRVVRAEAADAINVKLGKSGPLAVADIVSIAHGANLDLLIGCMLEGAIGIHTGAHVVAGTGVFSYVDLDGNRLLAADVVPTEEGTIHDISGPGHGITPQTHRS